MKKIVTKNQNIHYQKIKKHDDNDYNDDEKQFSGASLIVKNFRTISSKLFTLEYVFTKNLG